MELDAVQLCQLGQRIANFWYRVRRQRCQYVECVASQQWTKKKRNEIPGGLLRKDFQKRSFIEELGSMLSNNSKKNLSLSLSLSLSFSISLSPPRNLMIWKESFLLFSISIQKLLISETLDVLDHSPAVKWTIAERISASRGWSSETESSWNRFAGECQLVFNKYFLINPHLNSVLTYLLPFHAPVLCGMDKRKRYGLWNDDTCVRKV